MICEFTKNKISVLRQKMAGTAMGRETARQVQMLIEALEEGAFCFRLEPWHNINIHNRSAAEPISEMLLHILKPDTSGINVRWAISAIYDSGYSVDLDQILAAAAIRQAGIQGSYPAAINISPESACNKRFWEEMASVPGFCNPGNIIFELIEEDFTPGPEGLAALAAARKTGFRFALDDIENNTRDEKRIEVFGDLVDFVKIGGVMIEEWEIGLPGLSGFVGYLRSRVRNTRFIAEWVSSAAKARLLAEIGFDSVQGRYLPVNREEFTCRFSNTPARRLQMVYNNNLSGTFAGVGT